MIFANSQKKRIQPRRAIRDLQAATNQTSSAKRIYTFHENNRDVNAIKAELDIDFFSDPLSHFFLEVVPNKITGGKTDPKTVYVLPWMAALRKGISVRRTGLPDLYAERSDSQWNATLQDSTRKTIEHFGGAGRWWLSS